MGLGSGHRGRAGGKPDRGVHQNPNFKTLRMQYCNTDEQNNISRLMKNSFEGSTVGWNW
jgi:hypothetical protein